MPSQDFDLTDVVTAAMEARLAQVYTTMPGRVISYDSGSQTAVIQPLINEPAVDETGETSMVTIPQIQHVQIRFPGSGACRLTFPIRVGDIVQLEFSNSCLSSWKILGGGPVDPTSFARHDINDAVASPGMPDGPRNPTSAPTNKTILHSDVDIELGGGTQRKVLTTQSSDVFMNALANAVIADTTGALAHLQVVLSAVNWASVASSKVSAETEDFT